MQEKITTYLVEKYHPIAVILHGSRANGNESDTSDWDVMLMVNGGEKINTTFDFEGEIVDVTSFSKDMSAEDFVLTYGAILNNAKILHDIDGVGEKLVVNTQDFSKLPFESTETQINDAKRAMNNVLRRLKSNLNNQPVFFYRLTRDFFPRAYNWWFVYKNKRYSVEPKTGFLLIQKEDPEYYAQLEIIWSNIRNEEKVLAVEKIINNMFQS
jgi:predicted nucleotidyltransferase